LDCFSVAWAKHREHKYRLPQTCVPYRRAERGLLFSASQYQATRRLFAQTVAAFGSAGFDDVTTVFRKHSLKKSAAFLGFADSPSQCAFHDWENSVQIDCAILNKAQLQEAGSTANSL
jgi:hypothetical protein